MRWRRRPRRNACLFGLLLPRDLPYQPALALDPTKALTQYVHSVWRADDGLPHNSVMRILETQDGYLWVGTQNGLGRFDGVRFTVFDRAGTPSLLDNWISDLVEDRQGTLWIATSHGGLSMLSRRTVFPRRGNRRTRGADARRRSGWRCMGRRIWRSVACQRWTAKWSRPTQQQMACPAIRSRVLWWTRTSPCGSPRVGGLDRLAARQELQAVFTIKDGLAQQRCDRSASGCRGPVVGEDAERGTHHAPCPLEVDFEIAQDLQGVSAAEHSRHAARIVTWKSLDRQLDGRTAARQRPAGQPLHDQGRPVQR